MDVQAVTTIVRSLAPKLDAHYAYLVIKSHDSKCYIFCELVTIFTNHIVF